MGFICSREGHIWLWVSVCWLNAWISATSDKINISVSAQEFWIHHLWYLYGTIYVGCDKASDWSNSLPSTSNTGIYCKFLALLHKRQFFNARFSFHQLKLEQLAKMIIISSTWKSWKEILPNILALWWVGEYLNLLLLKTKNWDPYTAICISVVHTSAKNRFFFSTHVHNCVPN